MSLSPAWLQSEIDMLVARGYVLFKGSWHAADESKETMRRRGIEHVLNAQNMTLITSDQEKIPLQLIKDAADRA